MAEETAPAVIQKDPLIQLMSQEQVRRRFEQLLGGRKGAAFISGIVSAWNGSDFLKRCDPQSVMAAGVMAATVNLPVTPGLGWAAIVPYKDKAQFQIMKDGFVQLGLRSGQYKAINCSDVYEDEFQSWNPHTGEFKAMPQTKWKQRDAGKTDKVVGYIAFFKLLNGFEKYSYWTIKQLEAHGKKYSQSYQRGKGLWVDNKPAMYLKTPLKLLLSHFGPLSTEMQYALEYDQAMRKADGTVEYPDGRVIDAQVETTDTIIPGPKRLSEAKTEKGKAEPKGKGKPEEAETASGPQLAPESWTMKRAPEKGSCENCADDVDKLDMIYVDDEGLWHHSAHYAKRS